jgi:hypothetical protein
MKANVILRTIRALGGKALYQIERPRYAKIYETRELVNGRLPVIYISQLWRSGGTMLSQFFDSVPGVLAFPKELKFGVGKGEPMCLDEWCERPPSEIRIKFTRVNGVFGDAARGAYDKSSGSSLPFRFDVRLFNYLFDRLWSEHPPRAGRDIAGIFFTAFFSAWLDRKPSLHPLRYISGFASFVAFYPGNVKRFFGYYPDGYLVQIIREPVSWYRSVKAKPREASAASGHDVDDAIEMYRQQAGTLEINLREFPGRCILLDYDQLVAEPAWHMDRLCARFGLENSAIAATPTFNGLPIGANSSFRDGGVPRESILSAGEIARLEREAMPIYEEVRRLTEMPPQSVAKR